MSFAKPFVQWVYIDNGMVLLMVKKKCTRIQQISSINFQMKTFNYPDIRIFTKTLFATWKWFESSKQHRTHAHIVFTLQGTCSTFSNNAAKVCSAFDRVSPMNSVVIHSSFSGLNDDPNCFCSVHLLNSFLKFLLEAKYVTWHTVVHEFIVVVFPSVATLLSWLFFHFI